MCGIAGICRWGDASDIRRMTDVLAHRGPDAEGFFSDERLGLHLGHRRLSILDLADGGQPMAAAGDKCRIVFNGEIFNAPELRQSLERDGHPFQTGHSDTEVLLQLYLRDGHNLLDLLNGMFAFVLHDPEREILFGARDPFGIKPLFYAQAGERFAFASELRALETLPGWSPELDRQAVFDYFTFDAIPAPRTIWRQARKIPAGHCFTYDLRTGQLRVERYWKRPRPETTVARADVVGEIRERFLRAVNRWSLSDVPIACSLSGGFDSSLVVAALSRKCTRPVPTFTLGFDEAPELDEAQLARRVVERYGTEHHEIRLRCDDLLDDMPAMIDHLGEPYAGGLPSWFVFKAMGAHFKVAMTGTGGDELFGNYGKAYGALDHPALLKARWRHWIRGDGWRDSVYAPHGITHYGGLRDREKRQWVFLPDYLEGLESSAMALEAMWRDGRYDDPRDAAAAVDLQLQLPEEFLCMTDRFSMAHSIEARTPMLDREFSEFVFSLPAAVRCGRPRLKQLLSDALGDLLPPELVGAPKRGFVLPMESWLKGRLRGEVERLTCPDLLRGQGIFRPSIRTRYCLPHLEGRKSRTEEVWKILQFQWWAERKGLLR